MGASASRYEETNWSTASGGLKSAKDTVDSNAPLDEHQRFILTQAPTNTFFPYPKPGAWHMQDKDGNLLYKTVPSGGAGSGFRFDVFDAIDNRLVQVRTNQMLTDFTILWINQPTYAGQEPAAMHNASRQEDDDEELLYKRTVMRINRDRLSAEVNMYESGEVEKDILLVQNVRGPKERFQTSTMETGPLVGFWKWGMSSLIPFLPIPYLSSHFVELELVKDSDMLLHFILVVSIHSYIAQERRGGRIGG